MNDLISRSEAIEALNQHYYETLSDYDTTVELLNELPSIDAVPVVHGEFEKQPEEVILNLRVTPLLCKTCLTTFITLNKEGKLCMCCSYCGARMDGEENAAD